MTLALVAAAACVLALLAVGAWLPIHHTRAAILAVLLLVPDVPTGASLGLFVQWSAGLTLSNFIVPMVALPLLLGAWLAGKPLLPVRWPALARWSYALLGWAALSLLPPWFSGALGPAPATTLTAHWLKLALFLFLGVVLAVDDAAWRRLAARWLLAVIAMQAAVGLAQAGNWFPTFSPLADGRATGLFYDANMYAVLAAWALLVLATRPFPRWPTGRWILMAAAAAAMVAAGSRAGYLALAVGGAALLVCGQGRALVRLAPLALAALLLFPARTFLRVQSSTVTVLAASSNSDAEPDASTAERLASMGEALRQIAARPLLGAGFGRALYLGLPAIRNADDAYRSPAAATSFTGAQNMPLTVLASMGPVGLVLLLAAMGAPLKHLYHTSPGHLAGYLGLLAACLTLEAFWNTRVLALLVLLTGAIP